MRGLHKATNEIVWWHTSDAEEIGGPLVFSRLRLNGGPENGIHPVDTSHRGNISAAYRDRQAHKAYRGDRHASCATAAWPQPFHALHETLYHALQE